MPLNHTNTTRRRAAAVAACLLALGLAACGEDDDTAAAATDDETTTTEVTETETPEGETDDDAAADGVVVEVTAKDWAFERLPVSIEAGTKLSLVNEGDEPHELVAIRIPDSETRGVNELVRLPQDELAQAFGGEPEPATVILAASGTTDSPGPVVGDGTLTEPGRYALVCFLPVGSDDSILESEGPPESDAPPHVSQGMFAELVVT